uniref:SecY-independent transporter protein n=1 Tax=Pleurosigma inscriptura TaxID=2819025 RepID=A0A8A3SRK3_9STRA|nr:SecY-independent transporter protein [Pleurosigma inscriptura]QSZ78240.1 SecY-independent transporter protein [Pleurosigma inscriptura]
MYKYYLELKNRFLLLSLTWVSTLLICYFYKEVLLFICLKPSFYNNNFIFYFIFTDIKEIFSVYFKLIIFLSNQVLMFYLIFHILAFIALGLYKFEYRYLTLVFCTSIFFWFFSLLIFNKILFPISLNFFLSFQLLTSFKSLNLHFEAKLSEYLNFYIMFYYICTFYCQIFIILLFFFDYINTDLKLIKRFRKLFYYLFIFLSTLVTPPDVVSQLLFSICLIWIYELLIFVNISVLIFKKV